ncbi:family 43 glycosylhydrolase [Polaribacter sp.]|uniref:family 43 glycosylhydrolase n=1 Tax=Polaribacter sp. TaxID=1920175 RepID=UPI0025F85A7D|nr:family 43 glycosylhydrolase [Polaribacter sp.]
MRENKNIQKLTFILLMILSVYLNAQNPIVPNKGLNDPHIHIFNDTAYVYASHDKSIKNRKFIMEDWWIWSSPDLINWKKESVLKPKDTYIEDVNFTRCWATDVAYRNGKYYWYFSEGNQQTGVVVGDSPTGPWKDPLGKPLLTSELTSTDEYDMAIFEENGEHYIVFGVWDYYIAKLNYDMISLAEKPRKLEVNNARGPYNQDGNNLEKPTDDKPFLHKYNGKYYLSWGCFYAMSDNLYGPYDYKDSVIKQESFVTGYDSPTWPNGFQQGRHGSFFEWNNQWYYAYCDISQTGNRYFRDTFISYVHYKENGEMSTIRVDGVGVANYNASAKIEAEDYFKAEGIEKKETENGFVIKTNAIKSYLNFKNVKGLSKKSKMTLKASSSKGAKFAIKILRNSLKGELIGYKTIESISDNDYFRDITFSLKKLQQKEDIYLIIEQLTNNQLQIDSFSFSK